MAVHTFDEYCEMEERERRPRRAGIFSDNDYAAFDYDSDDDRDYDAIEDLVRDSSDLEEIF